MATREEKKQERQQRKEQRKEQRRQKHLADDEADAGREKGRLLAKLCASAPDDLDAYRDKRLPPESHADAERLLVARGALLDIAEILESGTDDDWTRLRSVATALAERSAVSSEAEDSDDRGLTEGPSLATAKAQPDEPQAARPMSSPPPGPGAPVAAPRSPAPPAVAPLTPSDRPPNAPSPWAAGGSEPPGRAAPASPQPDPVAPPAPVRPPSVPPPGPVNAAASPTEQVSPAGAGKTQDAPKRTAPSMSKTRAIEIRADAQYLPFKGKASADPPKPVAAGLEDKPLGLGSTVVGEVMSPLASALPFEKKIDASGLPQLTLEQYASLCAERNAKPGELEATLRKYGLADSKAERALDDQWKATFESQPKQRERWLQMVREYTVWLESRG